MLEIRNLHKSYGGGAPFAVDDVSFEVAEGTLYTLLGPSGCGKTTTLRCIAGLERPDSGNISIKGQMLYDGATAAHIPANRRGLGMVFQSYAIWPHLNVFQNVEFPLTVGRRSARPAKAERKRRVERVLDAMQLSAFAGRPATKLSGGQQQRLALARALVMEPPLLLLDEPLSNLDAKLRDEMRVELKRLQRELGITSIYVTHDQTEALAMSTRIAVMNRGRIIQEGTPEEIYDEPNSKFVGDFIGQSNFIHALVGARDGDTVALEAQVGRFILPGSATMLAAQSAAILAIRPEQVLICRAGGPLPALPGTRLRGMVRTRSFMGETVEHDVAVGEVSLRVRTNPGASLTAGTTADLLLPAQWCRVLAPDA